MKAMSILILLTPDVFQKIRYSALRLSCVKIIPDIPGKVFGSEGWLFYRIYKGKA
jgi:hypothetical protein